MFAIVSLCCVTVLVDCRDDTVLGAALCAAICFSGRGYGVRSESGHEEIPDSTLQSVMERVPQPTCFWKSQAGTLSIVSSLTRRLVTSVSEVGQELQGQLKMQKSVSLFFRGLHHET